MKIEFIKRGAATRLILIFAGWSTDSRYYNDCVFDGWDTAVVCDYRDMTMPSIPDQYATVYVFAYSLGVAAASLCGIQASVRIAICGSPEAVSDRFGIPEAVYAGTLDGLSERSLMKFHLRMAGDKATYDSIRDRLPQTPDIPGLKEELSSIRTAVKGRMTYADINFDRVYLAEADRIFPYANLKAYWEGYGKAPVVAVQSSHAIDIHSIITDCLPDCEAIGGGFAKAGSTYNDSAVIQKEICSKMGNTLSRLVGENGFSPRSVLEIGVGQGLLTQVWRDVVMPRKATYIDLAEMPAFGIAPEERYLKTDAELWLERSDERFDLIVSASTIQWFADPIRFMSSLKSHLNPGGIALISTFVKGNLHELDKVRPCPMIYRTVEDYMSSTDCVAEIWERTLTFESVKDMLMHLRLTGVNPKKSSFRKNNQSQDGAGMMKKLTAFPVQLTYCPMIMVVKA